MNCFNLSFIITTADDKKISEATYFLGIEQYDIYRLFAGSRLNGCSG